MMLEPRHDRRPLRILVVEDDEADLSAVRRQLRRAFSHATLDEATTAAETLQRVASTAYDCLVLDYYLPDADELSLIRQLQTLAPDLPVVMLTGRGDEDIAVELMKAGVADYIPKASVSPERLAAGVRHAMELMHAAAARRRAEAELRAREAMFHTLANTIPQLAWMMNPAGERTWFNRRWLDYTGSTLSEMRGWGWQRVHHPAHIDRVVAGLRRSLETGEPWEDTYPLRGKDGTYRWFLSQAMPMRREDGTLAGWFGTNTDITAHLAAEQAVRESEERFRRALEIDTVGVLFFDAEGAITHANDAFLRMAGFDRDDVANGRLRWDDLTPAEWMPRSLRAVEEFKATGRTTPYEKEYFRRDGSRWWGLFAATRLNGREGVKFVVDITARKQAEAGLREALAQAEAATAAKSRFLAAISHDLRQPLQVIVGAYDLVKRAVTDERARRTLDLAMRATARLVRSVDNLAEISRLESGGLVPKRQRFPLQMLLSGLREIFEPTARSKGLELTIEPRDAWVESDPDMLMSILENLTGNAIKYTERGAVSVAIVSSDDGLCIEVRDTGIGIPPDRLQDIFQEYARLNPERSEGLGLGLAIVARQADMLRHALEVESTPGVGSCFRVKLAPAQRRA